MCSWNARKAKYALFRDPDICRERIKECLGVVNSKFKMTITLAEEGEASTGAFSSISDVFLVLRA